MNWNPFKIVPKRFLGIDIGTSSIKIVELSRSGEKHKLENFGEVSVLTLYEKPFRTFGKNTLLLSGHDIAKAIRAIMQEAKMQGKVANFSIPDFSTFFTSFELPPMDREEIPEAVQYAARQHVPLSLSEVTLDWQIINGEAMKKGSAAEKLQILLVSVPNQVINQYQEIAEVSGLKLSTLEAEAFALARASIKEADVKKIVALADIGARSTTVSIIDKGVLKSSYSFDASGNEFTTIIARALNIDYKKAEELKMTCGFIATDGEKEQIAREIRNSLLPFIDIILSEVEKVSRHFYQDEGRKINKIILAGGSALLPGLKDYCSRSLKKDVTIAQPFSDIFYPPVLAPTIKKMGPAYSAAVGLALRGLEK